LLQRDYQIFLKLKYKALKRQTVSAPLL